MEKNPLRRLHLSHWGWLMVAGMVLSLLLHLYLSSVLYVVEDESAYIQDAAQITREVLPFREFGATKGPVFLGLLHLWQALVGPTIIGSRLFPILAHVMAIPVLFVLARNLTTSRRIGAVAALLWAVSPVVVSLTTNVMHYSWELLFVLGTLALLSQPSSRSTRLMIAAGTFFWLALLTRATAAAFGPVVLLLLLLPPERVRRVILFTVTVALLLTVTVAIVYPLYGWPKTAFFFNADAVLIANDQRQVYADESTPGLQQLFNAFLPLWYEGLPLIIGMLCLPFIVWRHQYARWAALIGLGLLAWGLFPLLTQTLEQFWPGEQLVIVNKLARLCVLTFFVLTAGTLVLPRQTVRKKPQWVLAAFFIAWIGSFLAFYKGWGRTPTPYYVLEFTPIFAIGAAIVFTKLWDMGRQLSPRLRYNVSLLLIASISFGIVTPYFLAPTHHYRGTVLPDAAREMGRHIKQHVPVGEAIFTAQPIYPFLGQRPLYGYYTHPGWYLAERAGFLPASIRRVFFPDFEELARMVARDINWIVVDWRTTDVYFNTGTPLTLPYRELLEKEFTPVVTVRNPVSRDIVLYQRITELDN